VRARAGRPGRAGRGRPGAGGLELEGDRACVLEQLQPSLAHELLVDPAERPLEHRPHGRAEHGRLSVHRAPGGDQHVGERDEAAAVDRAVGHDDALEPEAADVGALLVGAGEHDGVHARVGGRAPQDLRQQRRLGAAEVERVGRRRAHHAQQLRAGDAERLEHAAVGLEVRQVVLLLQARIADQLFAARAVAGEALGRDRLRHEHPVGQPAVDVVLDRRPLVVEHRRVGDTQRPRDHRHVGRAVGERAVEALPPRPAEQLAHAAGGSERLVAPPHAAVAADHEMRATPIFEQLDRVRQRPRGQRDLVPRRLEALHERPQDDHVCRVGEVDPDAHGGHL